jgi:hypothetical protein
MALQTLFTSVCKAIFAEPDAGARGFAFWVLRFAFWVAANRPGSRGNARTEVTVATEGFERLILELTSRTIFASFVPLLPSV